MTKERETNLDEPQKCKHGLEPSYCEFCNPAEPPPRVVHLKGGKKRERTLRSDIEGLHLLGFESNIDSLPPHITALHVCRPLSVPKLEKILGICPSLQVIEFPPSIFDRFFRRDSAQAEFLKERNITVTSGMWQDKEDDLDRRDDRAWEERRKFLINLKPSDQKVLEKAKTMGFTEVEILERYFCLEEPRLPRINLVDLGLEQGLSLGGVRTRVLGLLAFLGWPMTEAQIQFKARGFKRRLKKALQAERDAQIRAEFEEFQPIPPGLKTGLWHEFHELTRIKAKSPDKLAKLPKRQIFILNSYFGLENGVHQSLVEIGKKFGITRERVRQLKNKALESLGITS